MSKYGEIILAERSRRRISQIKLARRAGLSTNTIIDIEYNRLGIDDETFKRIMDVMENYTREMAEPCP